MSCFTSRRPLNTPLIDGRAALWRGPAMASLRQRSAVMKRKQFFGEINVFGTRWPVEDTERFEDSRRNHPLANWWWLSSKIAPTKPREAHLWKIRVHAKQSAFPSRSPETQYNWLLCFSMYYTHYDLWRCISLSVLPHIFVAHLIHTVLTVKPNLFQIWFSEGTKYKTTLGFAKIFNDI